MEDKIENKYKKARLYSNKSLSTFATEIIKCSKSHWSDIENGKTTPNFDDLENLFEYRQKILRNKTLNKSFYFPDKTAHKQCSKYDEIKRINKQTDLEFNQRETIEDMIFTDYGITEKSLKVFKDIKQGHKYKDKLLKTTHYTLTSLNKIVESPYFLSSIDFIDNKLGKLTFDKHSYPKNRDEIIYEITNHLKYFATKFVDDYIAENLQNSEISKFEIKNNLQTKKDSTD